MMDFPKAVPPTLPRTGPAQEKPDLSARVVDLFARAQRHVVDFGYSHPLALQAPLGSYGRVVNGAVYHQARVFSKPSGAAEPLPVRADKGASSSTAKLLHKTMRKQKPVVRPAVEAARRPARTPQMILLSQAMTEARVMPRHVQAVRACLKTALLYAGDPPRPQNRIFTAALDTARLLARSTGGFKVLCNCAGPALAAYDPRGLAAVRMKLQTQDVLATAKDPAIRRCAQAALDAAAVRIAKGILSPAQQVAWFDWTQHQRGAQPDVLRSMQATLHKFNSKTIHRHGAKDSTQNSLLRLAGKRQGPLRAAMLGKPSSMAGWQGGEKAEEGSEAMRQVVRSIVLNLKEVPSVRLSDGHVYGLSTKQVSRAVVTAVALSGTPVSAHIDLQASKAGESFVEISRGQDGIRIFIGTCRKVHSHLTVGTTLGYEVTLPGIQGKASGSVAVTPLSGELVEPQGLVLRIARRMLPDGSDFDDSTMYRKALVLVDHLFSADAKAGAGAASPKATWQRLATAFHDEPDVSAGWIAERSTSFSGSAGASASMVPRVLNVTIGPQATVKATRHYSGSDSHEESGRRVAREWRTLDGYRVDSSLTVGLQLAGVPRQAGPELAAPVAGPAEIAVGLQQRTPMQAAEPTPSTTATGLSAVRSATSSSSASARTRQAVVMVSALEIPLSSSTSNHIRAGEVRLIEEDGELLSAVSTFDVEYKNLADWETAVLEESSAWQAALAEAPGQAGLDAAAARLSDYLTSARKNERPYDAYILRYRLEADVAARINLGNAFAKGLDGQQDAEALEQISRLNDDLLADRRSWMAAELKVRQFASQSRSSGFDLGAKLQRRQTLASERDWSRLKVSTAALQLRERPVRAPI